MTTEEALRTLNLAPPVSESSLKAAYRSLAKRFHPDRYASYDRQVWAGEKFIRVKEAYDFLRTMDLSSLDRASSREQPEPHAAPAPKRNSVFDNYADQSDFTERDFIAWLSLWRLGCALFRMLLKPVAGAAVLDSVPFQAGLGCLLLVLIVPFAVFVFPVVAMLVICFAFYVLLQKALITTVEKAVGTKIGPDASRLSGQLAYLGLLAVCAGIAVLFAIYLLRLQKAPDWITESLIWAFAGTLVVTWILETLLFVKARLLREKLSEEFESVLRVAD